MREIYSRMGYGYIDRSILSWLCLFFILLFSLTADLSVRRNSQIARSRLWLRFLGGVADLTARPVAAAMEKVLKSGRGRQQDRSSRRGWDVVRRQYQT
jgi:hypothetical protein